jgi:L-lactate dehydrogenase complex protein LldF
MLATRPRLYHAATEIAGRVLGWAGRGRGRFRSLPLAAGWSLARDLPAPQGRSFHSLWAARQRKAAK